MKPQYDAIVIGTGFGGAVSACRLAQANFKVGVFERGHRYPPAPFPRDAKDIMGGWLWQLGRGLFDIRALSEMTTVQAAGYGGGSLIYAQCPTVPAALRVRSRMAPGYSLDALAPYYALVSYMLDVKPITAASAPPPKTALMKDAASRQGRSGTVLLSQPGDRFRYARGDAPEPIWGAAGRMQLLRRMHHRMPQQGQEHA